MSARYEDDPRWQAAHEVAMSSTGEDEGPLVAMTRRIAATYDMYHVELEYEGGAA